MILCLLLTGCASAAPAGYSAERANVEGVRDRVASTAQMIGSVNAIIEWQVTNSEKNIEENDAARQNGETYVPEDKTEEVRQKQAELAGYLETVAAYSAWASSLRPCGQESVDLTYEAAAKYFSEVESALEDMADIMDFYFAFNEVAQPLSSFDASAYDTDKDRIYDLYYAVDEASTAMSQLDCPAFMAETYKLYISRLSHFMAILNEQYIGVQLNDPLRLAAGIYMLVRVEKENYDYSVMLTRDFNLQYEKVGERLGGGVVKYCGKCGAPLREGKSFCPQCGAEVRHPEPVAEPIAEPIPEPVAAPVAEQPSAPAAVKERRPRRGLRRLVTALIVLVLLGGLGAAGWYWGLPYIESLRPAGELPAVSYSYMSREPEIEIDYEAVDSIYPSLYNTTDYILLVRATSEGGERDVMIRAEVPGFTQVYEQKFTLGSQLTQFYIHPPVLTGELSLGSAKQAQIVFSVTDIDSGKPVIQDTLPIQIMSKFDMINYDPVLGVSSWDYYLSFLTPESPGVLELKRNAVDFITGYTGGQFDMMQGYQDSGLFGSNIELNTYYQALALQGAMSEMGVRYNNAWYSMSRSGDKMLQRVQLPDDTLSSKSGVCIETSLTIASALQSAGMNVFLIFPPGHAQVAVEAWPNTGEYYLIETTILPVDGENVDSIVTYKTQQEWLDYIQNGYGDGSGGCYVLNCGLATALGLLPLTN